MKYFYDLIESYELLKKRKLSIKFCRLYEQDAPPEEGGGDAEAIAQKVKDAALSLGSAGAPASNPHIPEEAEGQRKGAYVKKDGTVGGVNGHQLIPDVADKAGNPGPRWADFVGIWGGKTKKPKSASLQRAGEIVGQALRDIVGDTIAASRNATESIIANFQRIGEMLPDLCKKILGSGNYKGEAPHEKGRDAQAVMQRAGMKQKKDVKGKEKPCGRLFSYFVGGQKSSYESKMANCVSVTYKENPETGELEITEDEGQADIHVIEGVGKSLERVFELISKDKLTAAEKAEIKRLVQWDGTAMIVRSSGAGEPYGEDSEGLVFKDSGDMPGGIFKQLIEARVGGGFEVGRAPAKTGGMQSGDAAWRGLHFERVMTPINLQRQAQQAYADGDTVRGDRLSELAEKAFLEGKQDIARMIRVHAPWVQRFRKGHAAMPVDLYEIGKVMDKIYGEKSFSEIGAGLSHMSRMSMEIRKPTAIKTVGTETGFGKKADVEEGYKTPQDAIDALTRQGVSNPEKYVQLRNKEEWLSDITDPELRAYYERELIADNNGNIAVVGISLKNYEGATDTKVADYQSRLVDGFIQNAQPGDAQHDQVMGSLGFSPTDFAEIQQHQTELREIRNAVQGLDAANTVTTSNGEVVTTNTLGDFAKNIITALKADNIQADLLGEEGSTPISDLHQALTSIDFEKDMEESEKAERVRELVTRFLIDRKKDKDLADSQAQMDKEIDRQRSEAEDETLKAGNKPPPPPPPPPFDPPLVITPAMKHHLYETALISTSEVPILGEARVMKDMESLVYDANDVMYEGLQGVREGTHRIDIQSDGWNTDIVDTREGVDQYGMPFEGSRTTSKAGATSKSTKEKGYERRAQQSVLQSHQLLKRHAFVNANQPQRLTKTGQAIAASTIRDLLVGQKLLYERLLNQYNI